MLSSYFQQKTKQIIFKASFNYYSMFSKEVQTQYRCYSVMVRSTPPTPPTPPINITQIARISRLVVITT